MCIRDRNSCSSVRNSPQKPHGDPPHSSLETSRIACKAIGRTEQNLSITPADADRWKTGKRQGLTDFLTCTDRQDGSGRVKKKDAHNTKIGAGSNLNRQRLAVIRPMVTLVCSPSMIPTANMNC